MGFNYGKELDLMGIETICLTARYLTSSSEKSWQLHKVSSFEKRSSSQSTNNFQSASPADLKNELNIYTIRSRYGSRLNSYIYIICMSYSQKFPRNTDHLFVYNKKEHPYGKTLPNPIISSTSYWILSLRTFSTCHIGTQGNEKVNEMKFAQSWLGTHPSSAS